MQPAYQDTDVLCVQALNWTDLEQLCRKYALELVRLEPDAHIPGSYWQAPEAGLIGNRLYVRDDTPIHSLLHEGCHYICMDHQRRQQVHTDAGGDYLEENGVCYLQILLADALPAFGRERMMLDMDRWGYSFRLGSARSWFEGDAEDARDWLRQQGLIDEQDRPTWRCRDALCAAAGHEAHQ